VAKLGFQLGVSAYGLPTFTLEVRDIHLNFPGREAEGAGPFVLVNRACGPALDAGANVDGGWHVKVQPCTWSRQQLWYLRPTGVKGEVHIESADNGMVLDATEPLNGDIQLLLTRSRIGRSRVLRMVLGEAPQPAVQVLRRQPGAAQLERRRGGVHGEASVP
jgi:hypothetical protein